MTLTEATTNIETIRDHHMSSIRLCSEGDVDFIAPSGHEHSG
jgi:hypothetical protein